MRCWRNRRRPPVTVLIGLLFGVVVGLTACGDGEAPANLPSTRTTQRAGEGPASDEPRTPAPERTTEAVETTRAPTTTVATSERTRTPRSTAPVPTTTRPPTVTQPAPARTTQTTAPTRTTKPVEPKPTPAESASAVAATGATGGLGLVGWFLLLALAAALIVAWLLVARSQRRSGWDTEARALKSETRGITSTRLPPALGTTTTGRRALVWPPVRADLIDIQNRWNALTERASGDSRRNWALRVTALLHELITAVDIESEALGAGQDWTMLRVRVDQADRALAEVLSGQATAQS